MSEKWTIRELSPEEYPGTQLRYEVRDETDVVSVHFWEEDARQMAAVPEMYGLLTKIRGHIDSTCRECESKAIVPEIDALLDKIEGGGE